jgi:hypothetical protein
MGTDNPETTYASGSEVKGDHEHAIAERSNDGAEGDTQLVQYDPGKAMQIDMAF